MCPLSSSLLFFTRRLFHLKPHLATLLHPHPPLFFLLLSLLCFGEKRRSEEPKKEEKKKKQKWLNQNYWTVEVGRNGILNTQLYFFLSQYKKKRLSDQASPNRRLFRWKILLASQIRYVAVEREVEGDLLLGDMGQGLGICPGVLDGAISISAVQEKKYNKKCANAVIKSLGLNTEKIEKCMGDPDADTDNPVLKEEQDAQKPIDHFLPNNTHISSLWWMKHVSEIALENLRIRLRGTTAQAWLVI
ncbi:Vacuolar-sorting receptor 1 [Glycine soja]